MNEPVSPSELAAALTWGLVTAVLISLYVQGDTPRMRGFGLVTSFISLAAAILWISARAS